MPSPKENWLDTSRGVVHIGAPMCGGEYTVCGLAYDEPSSEHGGDAMQETALRPTCPDCIEDGRILLETLRRQLRRVGKCVTDIDQFPEHLRIRQVPWKKEDEE